MSGCAGMLKYGLGILPPPHAAGVPGVLEVPGVKHGKPASAGLPAAVNELYWRMYALSRSMTFWPFGCGPYLIVLLRYVNDACIAKPSAAKLPLLKASSTP